MKKMYLIVWTSLLLLVPLQVFAQPKASNQIPAREAVPASDIFRTKPYLQRPIGDEITICWETNVPVVSWVEYGKDGMLDRKKMLYADGQMICNNMRHHFRLSGLEPGETYSYRVCSQEITLYEPYKKEFGNTAVSDVYTFTLPEKDETDFTVLLFNDLHSHFNTMDSFANIIKEQQIGYDFVIFNGDCIDDVNREERAIEVLNHLNALADASNKPFFFLRGNHEIRGAYSIEMRKLFDYIDQTTYGAFSWGDTRFVTLDCGEDKPDSTWVYYDLNDFSRFRLDQVAFLSDELSSPEFKQAERHVLVHHIPIYGDVGDSYNPCFDLWHPSLKEAPFDISLNAHWHRFTYYPKGKLENNFPVVIGGGPKPEIAYMLILQKKGEQLTLRALGTDGKEKLKLEL